MRLRVRELQVDSKTPHPRLICCCLYESPRKLYDALMRHFEIFDAEKIKHRNGRTKMNRRNTNRSSADFGFLMSVFARKCDHFTASTEIHRHSSRCFTLSTLCLYDETIFSDRNRTQYSIDIEKQFIIEEN